MKDHLRQEGWPPCPDSPQEALAEMEKHVGLTLPSLAENFPDWFNQRQCTCTEGEEDTNALLGTLQRRAPFWMRVKDADEIDRVKGEMERMGYAYEQSSELPGAIKVDYKADITGSELYIDGIVEVQDIGSQLILANEPIQPGENWLDACAGAGGKALHLASKGANVTAEDVREPALEELDLRAKRTGQMQKITIRPTPEGDDDELEDGHFDGVLVDAPCSGSGTWRRSPHLKWATSEGAFHLFHWEEAACANPEKPPTIPGMVKRKSDQQLGLLLRHCKRGSRLVYSTCSLCTSENEGTVGRFLAERPDFRLVSQGYIRPHDWDSDGYALMHGFKGSTQPTSSEAMQQFSLAQVLCGQVPAGVNVIAAFACSCRWSACSAATRSSKRRSRRASSRR